MADLVVDVLLFQLAFESQVNRSVPVAFMFLYLFVEIILGLNLIRTSVVHDFETPRAEFIKFITDFEFDIDEFVAVRDF